jgi:hypothetical protein
LIIKTNSFSHILLNKAGFIKVYKGRNFRNIMQTLRNRQVYENLRDPRTFLEVKEIYPGLCVQAIPESFIAAKPDKGLPASLRFYFNERETNERYAAYLQINERDNNTDFKKLHEKEPIKVVFAGKGKHQHLGKTKIAYVYRGVSEEDRVHVEIIGLTDLKHYHGPIKEYKELFYGFFQDRHYTVFIPKEFRLEEIQEDNSNMVLLKEGDFIFGIVDKISPSHKIFNLKPLKVVSEKRYLTWKDRII